MADEANPLAPEVPPPAPVQAENKTPPGEVEPPPAANLVVNGEVTDERIVAAERRALEAERRAAELERDNQELKKIPPVPPGPPAKPKKRWQFSPIIGAEENND